MSAQHIVVIGAARSGTKILRDALATATGVGKVPYDVGYVWRIGNENLPHDAIAPAQVTEPHRRYIRRFVDRYAAGTPRAVIEKTVGNTLRVPAVAAVLTDAVFIHLVRDGVDVIESTRRQWVAPADLRYLTLKARHFPLRLVPTYGAKYVASLARRYGAGDERRIGSWGPRYDGIDRDLATSDLLTVCARQWRASVESAREGLLEVAAPTLLIRYEDFVDDPAAALSAAAEFAGLGVDAAGLVAACGAITSARAGMGRASLQAEELDALDVEVGDLLEELGYRRPVSQS